MISAQLSTWLSRWAALLISLSIAVVFALVHFIIESEFFEHGPLSKKGLIHLLDLKALDIKMETYKREDLPEPQVVIAAIDEKSVERYGLWPWSRTIIARFIDAATAGGASVISFDAVFSDEDKNSSYRSIRRFLSAYDDLELSPQSDRTRAIIQGLSQSEKLLAETSTALDTVKGKAEGLVKRQALGHGLERAERSLQSGADTVRRSREKLDRWQRQSVRFYDLLQQEVASISPDEALADAIGRSPNTILGYFNFYSEEEIVGIDPDSQAVDAGSVQPSTLDAVFESVVEEIEGNVVDIIRPVGDLSFADLQIRDIVAIQAPLRKFAERAKAFGYFNVPPDQDGIMRRVRLLNKRGNRLYPALSLISTARHFNTDIMPLNGTIKPGKTLDGIILGDRLVPTDLHGRALLNYYKDPVTYFPAYSVADFIEGTVPPEAFKGKVVLFGMTAQGLYDLRPTPFSPSTPGVYIHASAIQDMIDGHFLERYYGLALVEILGYLLLGVLMGITLPRVPAWAGLLVTLGFAASLYYVDLNLIFARGVWMLNVLPTVQAMVSFIGVAVYGYLTEGKEKRKIRKAFQFYLTKSVVDEMLKNSEKLRLGGEKRVCTVLFSDIRGFTTISERLSPEELVQLLNEYLTPMTSLVFKYDGTLDKYMGDAIMAIFGAPVNYSDHATRACYVSLEMMSDLHVLQEGWRERGLPELDIGIGLNTGPMSVGNMGSDIRFDYTVMGDNVNLGSRLEGINKTYGTNIIISEYTRVAAGDDIHCREMDAVRVKGKREPVVIYELLGKGRATGMAEALIAEFQAGLAAYKAQRWDEAIAHFARVRQEIKPNDLASGMYIQRCETMAKAPPGEGWDGVFTMTTK